MDLSHFDFSQVVDIQAMFYGCSELRVLDMSNIDMTSITTFDNIFNGVSSLQYLNIRGINNIKEEIFDSLSKMDLYVCQDTMLVKGDNIKNDCCFFYDDDISCKSNYIIVYYGSDHQYNNGYKTDGEKKYKDYYGSDKGEYRGGIEYLIYDNLTISPHESFTITAGSKLEIHFSLFNPIENLTSFFDHDYDDSEIISIDLTYFDSSKIISTKNMFHNCKSLISINISDFNTPVLKDMSNMFGGCKSLEFLNLTSFNTSSLEYFSNIFTACDNLKVLDISGLNFDNNNTANFTSIFTGLSSLEYINIQNTKFNNITQNDLLFAIINNDYINICRDNVSNVLRMIILFMFVVIIL